jgi:FKBP-type peptidyl-prolyl cis-trans isomerase 2
MRKIITFIIILFILYNILKANNKLYEESQSPSEIKQQESLDKQNQLNNFNSANQNHEFNGDFADRALAILITNVLKTPQGRSFMKNILQPINNQETTEEKNEVFDVVKTLFNISTTKPSKSQAFALCGYSANVSYKFIETKSKKVVLSDSKNLVLGEKSVIPALDAFIVGMKIGETVSGFVHPKYSFNGKNYHHPAVEPTEYYDLEVTLNSFHSELQIKPELVKIFDQKTGYDQSFPFICGQKVGFKAKIIRLYDGSVIYDSNNKLDGKKIETIIGNRNDPLIFGYGLHGKSSKGARTIIAPSKFFMPLNKVSYKAVQDKFGISAKILSSDEYLMLELYDLSE